MSGKHYSYQYYSFIVIYKYNSSINYIQLQYNYYIFYNRSPYLIISMRKKKTTQLKYIIIWHCLIFMIRIISML
jgi:hypothetical protein